DHVIKLIPGAKAASCKAEMDKFIQENLATGCIRPSKSPMAFHVFFIKKKDGSLQLVHNYRALNALMIKN
ncbi:hypothetical protein L208DRAFT_1238944, partial [Tricholoma matsutake]